MCSRLSGLQESPTGELAEYSFPPEAAGAEPSGQTLVGDRPLPQPQLQPLPSSPQESVNASEDLDGNVSEESKTKDSMEGHIYHCTY